MDIKTIDQIAQIGITIFGIVAIFLVARKNKWGFVCGICAQPFWYTTTFIHKQWWVLVMCLAYSYNWTTGAITWFRDPPSTMKLGKIRVTRKPGGKEDILMRGAWVGLELPCIFYGPVGNNGNLGYFVPQDQALAIMAKKNPYIASLWRHAGYPQPGRCFTFPDDEVDEVELVLRAN